ncbi:hypothetical protein K435DRAFT_799568 [Dendrothele bispora CBS 962.96]|uniref:Uncharacterized protein n=1 Tax=Dendrothele bispora (strain CBS 962.96) TaxID=1314807 RepID=A0A4S8LVH2_DENBC|nr:hypothetical protein K435DRAFT_799568 [Dendrothele bispora CBS 962.96]
MNWIQKINTKDQEGPHRLVVLGGPNGLARRTQKRIFVENHNFAPASKDNRSELLLLRVQSCKVYEVEPGAESGPYDYAKPLVMMWKLNCFALGTPKTFYMEENSPFMLL